MWKHRSDILISLTKMTSKQATWNWTKDGWIEICSLPKARAGLVLNQAELAWCTRYLLPNKITVNRCKELLAEFKSMMANDYRIPCNSISERNPQQTQLRKSHLKLLVILYIPL